MSLPYTCGTAPPVQGRLRTLPEDFQVDERLGFQPTGCGEHLLVQVRKRNANTEWVARQLAHCAGVAQQAVSYAGLKDRRALTTQWFSIHTPNPTLALTVEPNASFSIQQQVRHNRKLRRGALKENLFQITIRDVHGPIQAFIQRLQHIQHYGVPNYFGPQRFGHANIEHAQALFAGAQRRFSRHQKSVYLSAARALIFNQLLARRVRMQNWNQALIGDAMILDGSRSFFVIDDDINIEDLASIRARADSGDLHPSGPLWGCGPLPTRAAVQNLECVVGAEFKLLCDGLARHKLHQQRRSLRLWPRQMDFRVSEPGYITLRFSLPPGGYATSVLRELLTTQTLV